MLMTFQPEIIFGVPYGYQRTFFGPMLNVRLCPSAEAHFAFGGILGLLEAFGERLVRPRVG